MNTSTTMIVGTMFLLAGVSTARAQSGCPEMPATVIHRDATKGSVEANLLSKLVSRFQVRGELDKSVDDVFNKDGAIERAKMIALTYQCEQILAEYPHDFQRRRDEFRKEFAFLFGLTLPPAPTAAPVPSQRSPSAPARVSSRPMVVPTEVSDRESGSVLTAHNPDAIQQEHTTGADCERQEETVHVLVSPGMPNLGPARYNALATSLGCDYRLFTDFSSRRDSTPLNVMAMKGPVTYRAQVSIIRALLKQRVYIKAVCASELASQPDRTVLLTHVSLDNAENTGVSELTPQDVAALARTENSRQFNALLAGTRRCSVP